MWTFRVRGGARLLLGTYGSHECRQEMGKIPNFTDSERLKTPKTDCMCAKGLQRQRILYISLDSRFIDLENTRERATR